MLIGVFAFGAFGIGGFAQRPTGRDCCGELARQFGNVRRAKITKAAG